MATGGAAGATSVGTVRTAHVIAIVVVDAVVVDVVSGNGVGIICWFQATTAVSYRGERSAVPWGEDLAGLGYFLTGYLTGLGCNKLTGDLTGLVCNNLAGDLTGLVWNILTGDLTGLVDDLTRGGFVYQNLFDGERGCIQQ